MIRLAGLAALFSILAAGLDMAVQAQPKKSDAYVKVTAKGDKPDADGKQTVTVTIQIEKGWHIYANPVSNENLKADDYRIYEGRVEIKARLQRAKGEAGPLEVGVRIHAVPNNGVGCCLLPATVKVPVQ
jgi:hypothetical protein